MDDKKLPYSFRPDPELEDVRPLPYSSKKKSNVLQNQYQSSEAKSHDYEPVKKRKVDSSITEHDSLSIGNSNNLPN